MGSEFQHVLAAIIILTIAGGFSFAIGFQWETLLIIFTFSIIIISLSVLTKKVMAHLLDADVEHEIWTMSRYGLKKSDSFKKPVPTGIIIPIILTIISLGTLKFLALLTYEARALKYRTAKRFGFYSYTEMTDWHTALIGASGILIVLLIGIITYFLPGNLEYLSKLAIYYAFWNILPISKLDGAQIFFGSRILWTILATIIAILTFFALTLQ